MDDFAKIGPPDGASAWAALALMRALLRHLEKNGELIPKDKQAIIQDALAQIPSVNNERNNETKRLLNELLK